MIKPNNYRSGGSPYYFHAGSRTSQYDRPKGDLPAGCQRCTSSGGQVYYFHAASRRSQFERQARWPATTCKSIPSCSGSRPCEGHPQRIVRSLNGSLESYALSLSAQQTAEIWRAKNTLGHRASISTKEAVSALACGEPCHWSEE